MSASAVMLAEPMPWWKLLAMVLIFTGLALNMTASRTWFRRQGGQVSP
jgi:hypothetical protein